MKLGQIRLSGLSKTEGKMRKKETAYEAMTKTSYSSSCLSDKIEETIM